jgi:hypothetical protein
MRFLWPASAPAYVVWSLLLLGWVVALYYVGRTESIWGRVKISPTKSWWRPAVPRLVLLAVLPFLVIGRAPRTAIALMVLGYALALMLTVVRERGKDGWRTKGAEFELGITIAYALLSALIVGDGGPSPLFSIVQLPLSDNRLAALCFSAAILGFLHRGGTQVVRAILTKAGSLPTVASEVDEVEYNRGRLIGSIERLLLAGVVAAGSYAGLGFLVAAKGLVRSKDLEKHEFAEYFLIGTLASTALAMIAGGLLRLVFTTLW